MPDPTAPPAAPAAAPAAAPSGNLQFILRAFKYRNYRLLFVGQLISLLGSWLTIAATQWLVYRLASDRAPDAVALLLGMVGFAGQIPLFILAPFAGVWVDRWPRHRILLITQFLSMLQSFALAYLALRRIITIPQVVALNAFQGVVNALDVPARQAFVVEMVEDREDLGNAIALSSSMVHAARMVGPAVAGVLIYHFGPGSCFLLDGISYTAVLVALLMMTIRPRAAAPGRHHPLRALKEGIAYSFGFAPIRAVLLLVATTALVAVSLSTLMPIFADRVLGAALAGGRERVYGLLLGASGVGAFAGTIYLAARRSVLGLGRVIVISNALLGVALVAFAYSRSLWLSLPILLVTGGAMVTQMAAANTVLQTLVDDDKRGRVMSLFSMCFMGVAPFGQLLAGSVAHATSPQRTVMLSGVACVASAGLFALTLPRLRPLIRPIYVRKGIIREVAAGVETTANTTAATGE